MSESRAERFNRRREAGDGGVVGRKPGEPGPPTNRSSLTDRQLTEQWQQYNAGHLERQTKALESLRGMVMFFVILSSIGLILGIISALG